MKLADDATHNLSLISRKSAEMYGMDGSDENVLATLQKNFRGNKHQRGVDVRKGPTKKKKPKENRMNGKKKRKEMVISWRNTKLLETHGPLPVTKDIFTTVRIGPPPCLVIAVIILRFYISIEPVKVLIGRFFENDMPSSTPSF